MKALRLIFTIMAALLVMGGCESDFHIDGEAELVVEGWIEAGGYPVVIVSQTIPATSDNQGFDQIDSYMMLASVVISDGENTMSLGQTIDLKHYPTRYYTGYNFKGEEGKTYTLTVKCAGVTATASTTIPPSVPIENARYEAIEGQPDHYRVFIDFKDPSDRDDWYKIYTKVENKDNIFNSAPEGVFKDSDLATEASVEVKQGACVPEFKTRQYYESGDIVHIKLCTTDELLYNYWRNFEEVTSLSRNPLFPITVNAPSNMKGAKGYWAGYGLSEIELTIP